MVEVTLNIDSSQGARQVTLTGETLTIGRTDASSVVIRDDSGLSRRHVSIRREDDKVWIVDEQSTNGSYVNGELVPPDGTVLADGDRILIGNHTTIAVSINISVETARSAAPPTSDASPSVSMLAVSVIAIVFILLGAVCLLLYKVASDTDNINQPVSESSPQANTDETASSSPQEEEAIIEPAPSPLPSPSQESSSFSTDDEIQSDEEIVEAPAGPSKLYKSMTDEEKKEFIRARARRIAFMMGKRPYAFTPEALRIIKEYVEQYVTRTNNRCLGLRVLDDCSNMQEAALSSQCLWGENLSTLYGGRARCFAPLIVRSFSKEGVPPVVGLYLAMIETEYHTRLTSHAGAGGLFQLMPGTARYYGVAPADVKDPYKSTPAAAKYMRDRILDFGEDPMSVALGIAGYNRDPESVKRDLRNVLSIKDNEDKERSFWTLIANKDTLDHWFQGENIKYVPKFFAAAIVGETPQAFGLDMRRLSTYAELANQPDAEASGAP